MTTTVVRSVTVVDELIGDEGSLLLVGNEAAGHRVLKITTMGQVIREGARGGIALPVLVEQLIEEFGPPSEDLGEATRLVRTAVEALAAEGVLTLE